MTEDLIWLFLLNSACSLILTGIIWFQQIVHYPSYQRFHRAEFKHHHRHTVSRTALIALPVMITELISSIILVANSDQHFFYHFAGLMAVILIWLSSIFIQVPLQFRLQKNGYNEDIVKKLTDTNWLRTLLWTAKSLLALQALLLMITS